MHEGGRDDKRHQALTRQGGQSLGYSPRSLLAVWEFQKNPGQRNIGRKDRNARRRPEISEGNCGQGDGQTDIARGESSRYSGLIASRRSGGPQRQMGGVTRNKVGSKGLTKASKANNPLVPAISLRNWGAGSTGRSSRRGSKKVSWIGLGAKQDFRKMCCFQV